MPQLTTTLDKSLRRSPRLQLSLPIPPVVDSRKRSRTLDVLSTPSPRSLRALKRQKLAPEPQKRKSVLNQLPLKKRKENAHGLPPLRSNTREEHVDEELKVASSSSCTGFLYNPSAQTLANNKTNSGKDAYIKARRTQSSSESIRASVTSRPASTNRPLIHKTHAHLRLHNDSSSTRMPLASSSPQQPPPRTPTQAQDALPPFANATVILPLTPPPTPQPAVLRTITDMPVSDTQSRGLLSPADSMVIDTLPPPLPFTPPTHTLTLTPAPASVPPRTAYVTYTPLTPPTRAQLVLDPELEPAPVNIAIPTLLPLDPSPTLLPPLDPIPALPSPPFLSFPDSTPQAQLERARRRLLLARVGADQVNVGPGGSALAEIRRQELIMSQQQQEISHAQLGITLPVQLEADVSPQLDGMVLPVQQQGLVRRREIDAHAELARWDKTRLTWRGERIWRLACCARVWAIVEQYKPATIRALVAQQAVDYAAAHGLRDDCDDEYDEDDEEDYEQNCEDKGSGEVNDFEIEEWELASDDEDNNGDGRGKEGEKGWEARWAAQTPPHESTFSVVPAQTLPLPPPVLGSIPVARLRELDFFAGPSVMRGTLADRRRRAAWATGDTAPATTGDEVFNPNAAEWATFLASLEEAGTGDAGGADARLPDVQGLDIGMGVSGADGDGGAWFRAAACVESAAPLGLTADDAGAEAYQRGALNSLQFALG